MLGECEQGRLGRAAREPGDLDGIGRADQTGRDRDRILDGALVLTSQREPLEQPRMLPHEGGEADTPARRPGIELIAQHVDAFDGLPVGGLACELPEPVERVGDSVLREEGTISSRKRSLDSRLTPDIPACASRSVSGSIRKPSLFS